MAGRSVFKKRSHARSIDLLARRWNRGKGAGRKRAEEREAKKAAANLEFYKPIGPGWGRESRQAARARHRPWEPTLAYWDDAQERVDAARAKVSSRVIGRAEAALARAQARGRRRRG